MCGRGVCEGSHIGSGAASLPAQALRTPRSPARPPTHLPTHPPAHRITFDKENVRDLSTPTTVSTRQGEDVAIGTTFIPQHLVVSAGGGSMCVLHGRAVDRGSACAR